MKEDQKKVLKAWIDGDTIQYQSSDGLWRDCFEYGECNRMCFNDDGIYRIRPKNIVKTTFIRQDGIGGLQTFSSDPTHPDYIHNLRMTFSPEGKLLKAEVI